MKETEVAIYLKTQKHLRDETFSITRRKSDSIDGLPFQFLASEYVYEVKITPLYAGIKPTQDFYVDLDAHDMKEICAKALAEGVDWPAYGVDFVHIHRDNEFMPDYTLHFDALGMDNVGYHERCVALIDWLDNNRNSFEEDYPF